MTKPTCDELWNEELDSIERIADGTWRHGSYVTEIFKRDSDRTFWRAEYQASTDGETNGLRQGDADITQVTPKVVERICYVPCV